VTGEREAPVVTVRPHLRGVRVVLACGDCAARFEVEQPGLGGIPIGSHPCACGREISVLPRELLEAIARDWPDRSIAALTRLTERATALAEGWHREPKLRERLRYRDVELGPPTERELMGLFALALRDAREREAR
jgi:hypothetical protein